MKSNPPESHWPLTILLGLSSLFNLFLPLVLVRILSPDQVGLYKLFFLYSMTAPWVLLSSGFAKGLYFWGGHWGSDKDTRFESFSATWSYQLRWMFGVLVVGFALIPLLRHIPSFLFSDVSYLMLLISCIALIIPSTFYEECRVARGENKIAVPASMATIKVIHPQGGLDSGWRAFTPSITFGSGSASPAGGR